MGEIDWSKAGRRLRHSPPKPGVGNPDWNWAQKRWKNELDYAVEELTPAERVSVPCPVETCQARTHEGCIDTRGRGMSPDAHTERLELAAKMKGWK